MRKKQQIASLLLALILALSLAACGGSSLSEEESAAVGKYTLISYTYSGLELSADEGDYLDLRDDGKAELSAVGMTGTVKWSLADGVFTISEGGDDYIGELDGNVIRIEMEDVLFLFAREGSAEADQLKQDAENALDEYVDSAFDEALEEAMSEAG